MSRANPKASGRPPAGLRRAQGGPIRRAQGRPMRQAQGRPIRRAQGRPGRKGVGGLASLFQGRRHLGNLRESQGPARRRRTEFRGNCGADGVGAARPSYNEPMAGRMLLATRCCSPLIAIRALGDPRFGGSGRLSSRAAGRARKRLPRSKHRFRGAGSQRPSATP